MNQQVFGDVVVAVLGQPDAADHEQQLARGTAPGSRLEAHRIPRAGKRDRNPGELDQGLAMVPGCVEDGGAVDMTNVGQRIHQGMR
jgi:hypothetical protein